MGKRISLDVVVKGKGSDYTPTMPRMALKELTKRIVASKSLEDAAVILREQAEGMDQGTGTWGFFLLRLADAFEQGVANFKVFAEGNSKLPFFSFSALPEYTCPGAGECLDWCYSFTAWRYPAAWARQVQNTMFLKFRPDIIREAFLWEIPSDVVVRLYVDGDFDSARTVRFWFKLLRKRPDLKVYGYSKSWALLWAYAQKHTVPSNYLLNLSSGGKDQGVSREQMASLPFVRGDFIAIPINYRPEGHKGNLGFAMYEDPNYHRAVRAAAAERGMGKVFSCPGKCGECCGGQHACGTDRMRGVTVVIGMH